MWCCMTRQLTDLGYRLRPGLDPEFKGSRSKITNLSFQRSCVNPPMQCACGLRRAYSPWSAQARSARKARNASRVSES